MVAQMIELGLLAPINYDNIPNFANVAAENKDPSYDPENVYSVPYFWGTTGIGYDASVVDPEPDSWAWLFEPEKLEQYGGQGINLLDDQRELIGAALIYLGYDGNDTDETHLMEARDLLLSARPYWTSFDSSGYIDNLLIPGEVVLTHGWNGDVLVAAEENENWVYVTPKEGGFIWQDNYAIPASSSEASRRRAEHFINWMLEPEVSARNAEYVFYATPNEAAKSLLDEEILEDPSVYPSEETLAKLDFIQPLPTEALEIWDRVWTEVKAGQ